MIIVTLKENFDPRYPDFPVRRLVVDLLFEPRQSDTPPAYTYYEGAFIDTAAPYVVIPYNLHSSGHLKIHQDLGRKPYRSLAETGALLLQPFAMVGLRFLVKTPTGQFAYEPEQFLTVKAYLLDAQIHPLKRVLLGLDLILENFLLQVNKDHSFLQLLAES